MSSCMASPTLGTRRRNTKHKCLLSHLISRLGRQKRNPHTFVGRSSHDWIVTFPRRGRSDRKWKSQFEQRCCRLPACRAPMKIKIRFCLCITSSLFQGTLFSPRNRIYSAVEQVALFRALCRSFLNKVYEKAVGEAIYARRCVRTR